MPSRARGRTDDPGRYKVGEPVVGRVDRRQSGNRPTAIGHDDLVAVPDAIDVSAQSVLEIPDPDFQL